MDSSPSPEAKKALLRVLMHKTPVRYQMRLALAHHLKIAAGNPNLSSRFGALEQQAGRLLAESKYPLSPELEAKVKAGDYNPLILVNQTRYVEGETPGDCAFDEVICDDLPMSPEEREAMWAGFEHMRASFPRLTPPVPEEWKARQRTQGQATSERQETSPFALCEILERGSAKKMDQSLPFTILPSDFRFTESGKNSGSPSFSKFMRNRFNALRLAGVAFIAVVILSFPFYCFLARSYTGIVSDLKGTRSGVLLDLDGHYPAQKMSVWVTEAACVQLRGHWPQVGARLKVTGKRTTYHDRPEIVVNDKSQLVWQ
jgi:hypothetical protein